VALRLCAGLISAIAVDPYHTSELTQAIGLIATLPCGSLLLADALYGSFLNLALVTRRQSHLISPRKLKRKGEKLKRLGRNEWLERITRPLAAHSCHPELLVDLPAFQDVRVIKAVIQRKGYRDITLFLCTTLLDHLKYPAQEIVAIYLRRWNIELDIRSLKLKHGLARLTCKSPQTVEREIYSACLAFNSVRATMAETGQPAHRLSHASTLELLRRTDDKMSFASRTMRAELVRTMLELVAAAVLPHQPRPPEPRAVVHSVRRFPYLKCTRKQWRAWHRATA